MEREKRWAAADDEDYDDEVESAEDLQRQEALYREQEAHFLEDLHAKCFHPGYESQKVE